MSFWKKLRQLKKRYKKYRRLGKQYRENPIEPWAFIRVKNEIKTIQSCMESIVPVIKKGVIGYHKLSENEVDDGTERYLKEFCQKNPGYILYKYEYEVIPANDKRYKDLGKIALENRLDSFYNACLSKIPQGEWFMKIDCDHVYDTKKLKQYLYLVQNDDEVISYSRLNLHYENKVLFFIKNNTLCDPGDSWLLKNCNLYFKFCSGFKDNKFYAWEELVIPKELKIYNTGLFNWHFPFVKSSRNIDNGDLIEFKKYKIPLYDKLYYHISKDIINEKRILNICKKFNDQ